MIVIKVLYQGSLPLLARPTHLLTTVLKEPKQVKPREGPLPEGMGNPLKILPDRDPKLQLLALNENSFLKSLNDGFLIFLACNAVWISTDGAGVSVLIAEPDGCAAPVTTTITVAAKTDPPNGSLFFVAVFLRLPKLSVPKLLCIRCASTHQIKAFDDRLKTV
uniref:Uncharacterized protein n=1 Tax=Setaria digitata TaxID=48799 RepID=A0A915PQE1_9BILA